MSCASLTIPAGMTSSKLSRLKSIKPSRLRTSCLLAKNRAKHIPKSPPRPNMNQLLRLLLLLVVRPFSFETGTSCTSSPLLGTRSRGLGDGEGVSRRTPPMRCRRADMARNAPAGRCGSISMVRRLKRTVYYVPWVSDVNSSHVRGFARTHLRHVLKDPPKAPTLAAGRHCAFSSSCGQCIIHCHHEQCIVFCASWNTLRSI